MSFKINQKKSWFYYLFRTLGLFEALKKIFVYRNICMTQRKYAFMSFHNITIYC